MTFRMTFILLRDYCVLNLGNLVAISISNTSGNMATENVLDVTLKTT